MPEPLQVELPPDEGPWVAICLATYNPPPELFRRLRSQLVEVLRAARAIERVYSPCKINFANSSTHMGQIFGGSDVAINNQFNLDYYPLPVWGVDPNSLPTVSYNVDINYKRETQ